MAQENYIYRWNCTNDGRLICQANYSDFDPLTDAWQGTSSLECREYGTINDRPRTCRGRGASKVSLPPTSFSNFIGDWKDKSMTQNAVSVGSLLVGGYIARRITKNSSKKEMNMVIGSILGLYASEFINKYIK